MFGSRLNYDSHFYISGQELSGVNSIQVAYQNAANVTKPLGYSAGIVTVGGPPTQTISLSRYFIYNDPLSGYKDGQEITGSLNYNGNSYGFQNGYLSDYSVNCAVGAIPQVNATILVYDELRTGVDASGSVTTDIYIPSQGSMTVTCDNVTTNRVVGFDYSEQRTIKPYYTIGAESPVEVKPIYPVTYTASIQMEVDDAFPESGYSFLTSGKDGRGGIADSSVKIQINGRDGTDFMGSAIILPYPVLVGETLSASADGSLRLTLNYIGHL